MHNKVLEKIEKFFNDDLTSHLNDLLIFQNPDGSYELFNKFIIYKKKNTVLITNRYNDEERMFSTLKNAVTWCIFEHRKKYNESQRIEYLDKIIAGIDANIAVHKKLISSSSTLESKLIYVAKLSQETLKRKVLMKEMNSFVTQSFIWQTRKFASK